MLDMGGLPYDGGKFPRGSCELGAGCWCGPQNRFVIPAYDAEGLIQNMLGRGNNLIGYYMFQGGTQQAGMEMAGHPLSYDFQAPVGEFGQVRKSYHTLKLLHHFMNDFGHILAPMQPVRPEGQMLKDPRDSEHLRYTSRFKEERGFLFMSTCQPYVKVKPIENIQIPIKLKNETILFPSKPFTLSENMSPIFPINLDLNGTTLRHSTAQLSALNGATWQIGLKRFIDGKPHELTATGQITAISIVPEYFIKIPIQE